MVNSVTKDMSIGEVLRIHRGTARIFMEFGMHCLGCPHATAESLADAPARPTARMWTSWCTSGTISWPTRSQPWKLCTPRRGLLSGGGNGKSAPFAVIKSGRC